MSNSSLVRVDLVVVASLVGLVTKEVDLLEALAFYVTQTIGFVPASRENVKRNLATDGVSQSQVWEIVLESLNHLLSDLVLQVVLLVVISLLGGGVSSNWRNIDHTLSEFNKRSSSDRQVQIGKVSQDKLDQLVVLLFANPANKGCRRKRFSKLVGGQTIFTETEIKLVQNVRAQLLDLLGKITSSNKSNNTLLSEGLQSSLHLWRDGESGWSQGSVNVEKTDGLRLFSIGKRHGI
ncbi:hypothetical protein OGATHE_003129 [Ogataea polymorpha]|uniref:Uncharacterized protein n=1 Tax=Ogataea polymorpha TaxID=460523 RepID=A0A9P8T6A1_9ASCO|nr:hypothetical protein OGATHE_003129 [Ogataea polymorpha]